MSLFSAKAYFKSTTINTVYPFSFGNRITTLFFHYFGAQMKARFSFGKEQNLYTVAPRDPKPVHRLISIHQVNKKLIMKLKS